MRRAVYYYTLVGCLAGVLGWFAATWLMEASGLAGKALLTTLVLTSMTGLSIGALVCALERLWDSGIRTCGRDLLLGALAGLAGGGLGGLLLFQFFRLLSLSAPLVARILGCLLVGALIGLAEGLRWRSARRAINGLIGGSIGGALGGGLYHFLPQFTDPLIPQAITFTLWGGFIAAGVSFVAILGGDAYLRGMNENRSPKYDERYLKPLNNDTRNIIGSGDRGKFTSKANIQIVGDDLIDSLHAVIAWDGRQWELSPYDLPQSGSETYLTGKQVTGNQALHDGDILCFGETMFRFTVRR